MKLNKNYNLIKYDVLDSTNKEAKKLCLKNNKIGNQIIWTQKQTSGYGKLNRIWEDSTDNLTFSIIMPHQYSIKLVNQFLFITSLSVYHTIKNIFDIYKINENIQVKWPNDILINNQKICGILIENIPSNSNNHNMIIGIGININTKPNIPNTTCLRDFIKTKNNINLEEIIIKIVNKIENYKSNWLINGFNNIKSEWKSHSYKLNEEITIKHPKENITGIFHDIDNNGSIILKTKSNINKNIILGDIL